MYAPLGEVTLKSGERMKIGVVLAPAPDWTDLVVPFLAHKPPNFKWHLDRAAEPLGALENRCYIGWLENEGRREVITNVSTFEYRGVGVFGHVFTAEVHRQKGACRAVMALQMEDFRKRDGQALYLGTGYDSHPYHLYASFGFRGIVPGSGLMRYWADNAFGEDYFRPRPATAVQPRWDHWPGSFALTAAPEGDVLRPFGAAHVTSFEGAFIDLMHGIEQTTIQHARVLETDDGAVAGLAFLLTPTEESGGAHRLELLVHPNFYRNLGALLEPLPSGIAIRCAIDSESHARAQALRGAGFGDRPDLAYGIEEQGLKTGATVFSRG